MMNKLFGRNEALEGIITGLDVKISEQNVSIANTNNQVIEVVQVISNIRQYMESMEVRVIRKMDEKFEEGFNNAVTLIVNEVKSLETSKPKELAKAIEGRTQEEKKLRRFRSVKTSLESMMAKYLVNDLHLHRHLDKYKSKELTVQGEAVYETISDFIIELAQVSDRNKEFYTNYGKYKKFFKMYGIEPYKRITVRKKDGSNMTTLLAAVIVNGHVRQYIDFILRLLEEEKNNLLKEEHEC